MLIDRDLIKKIVTWSVLLILIAVIVPLLYFLAKWNLSDCFLIPTVLYLAAAGLMFVVRMGTFDLFSFQFANWYNSWKKGIAKKYDDYPQYRQIKQEKRKNNSFYYLPYLVVGGICLILTIVFAIVLR